jgi:hypothetical protein
MWTLIAFCCSIALITFVGQFSADMKAGTDIFLPGVTVLALSVGGLMVFSVWRCIKNMKLLKSGGKGDD